MPKLVVVEGADIGKIYDLGRFNAIGSGKHNNILLTDRRVSKYHAQIELETDGYVIYNLTSKKDLSVNGEFLREAKLQSGDMIIIGDTILHFFEDTDSPTATVPTVDIVKSESFPEISKVITRLEPFKDPSVFLEKVKFTRSSQRLATLYKVSVVISETRNLKSLLTKMLEIIFEEIPAERGSIMILDTSRKIFSTEVSRVRGKTSEEIPYIHTITEAVLKNKKSILRNNVNLEDELFLSEKEKINKNNLISCMCVPLVCKNKILGIIYLDNVSLSQAFSEEDLDQLNQVALPAAIAIENALTYSQSEIYKNHLLSLGRFNQSLSSYFLFKDKIIQEAVHFAASLFECQQVSTFIYFKRPPRLQLIYADGLSKEKWSEVMIKAGKSLAWRSFVENRALLFPDIEKPLYNFQLFPEKTNVDTTIQSFMVSPIRTQSQESEEETTTTIGVICVNNKKDGGIFSRMELDLLSILANQIGIAITNATLYEKATTDPLTKLYVRRYFFNKLEEEVKRIHESPVSLLMLDLDHFKNVNDQYGHQTGDYVLKEVGNILKDCVRSNDIPSRYGGEEFAIILPKTECQSALNLAENIRKKIEKYKFYLNGNTFKMTISIGVGVLGKNEKRKQFLKRTDKALYKAKQKGRNQIVVA